ncbi:LOB domain-containing protein 6 [Acorus calamus]|uniref:LOB domain-containing protein 6 n=1 Tax=Acorus calamus TaxID=4465 RepID=A0AAV9CIN1_ACOCL|nr:LOB domain-containing protein 6 [Acorus calamus]
MPSSTATKTPTTYVTGSPCAACKFLRRKCQLDCVFAPYFPPDQPQKFANVHKVFGASNVTKLLNELHPMQREDAVNSLAYEADMRLRDPVYGCVGVISLLQHQLRQLQIDLFLTRSQLSKYHQSSSSSSSSFTTTTSTTTNFFGGFRENQQQEQFLMRNYGVVENGLVYDGGIATAAAALNGSPVGFGRVRAAGGDEQQSFGP